MSFRFEKLRVWQEARQFVSSIYTITKTFPDHEKFGLTDQIRRAAVSVMLNIAEGSDLKSDIEFVRFLRFSVTSLNEVVAAAYIASDQGYLNQVDFDRIYTDANKLAAQINKFIETLKKKP